MPTRSKNKGRISFFTERVSPLGAGSSELRAGLHSSERSNLPPPLIMKIILTLLTSICVMVGSNAFGDNISDRAAYSESMHRYITSLTNSGLTAERQKALEDLADKDSRFALPAIKRPDVFKDHGILVIALKYPARDVQIEAAKHLQYVGIEEDIPAILTAFDKLNQEIIIGGAAAFNNHRNFHDNLVIALASILKVPLDKKAPLDQSTSDKIVNAARQTIGK